MMKLSMEQKEINMGLYEIGKDKKGRPIKAYFDGRRVNEDIDAFYTSFANLVEKYGYEEIVGQIGRAHV